MTGKHARGARRILLAGVAIASAGGAVVGIAGTAQADPLSDLGIQPTLAGSTVPGLSAVFTGSAGPQPAGAAIATGSAQVGTGSAAGVVPGPTSQP